MKQSIVTAALAAAALGTIQGSWAAAPREAGAHVHGSAELNVAVEGNEVFIELHSPGMNLVGFEHQPSTEAERQALADALATLESGATVFRFSDAASCTLTSASVASQLESDGDDEHKEHQSAHSEVHGEWTYVCSAPEALSGIEVLVFERFPATEDIDVQLITATQQRSVELTADDNRIEF